MGECRQVKAGTEPGTQTDPSLCPRVCVGRRTAADTRIGKFLFETQLLPLPHALSVDDWGLQVSVLSWRLASRLSLSFSLKSKRKEEPRRPWPLEMLLGGGVVPLPEGARVQRLAVLAVRLGLSFQPRTGTLVHSSPAYWSPRPL